MAGNADFDQILSTTLKNYRRTLVDNIFKDRPLLDWLKRKDNIRMVDGGESIVEQLMYGQNSTAKSYSGWGTLDITPQDGITAAVFPWRQFGVSVAINGLQKAQNNGKNALVSLIKAKVMQAEESAAEVMNEMFFSDGSDPDADWYGLDLLVNDESAGITSVGGIDCATAGNEWWRSQVIDASSDGDAERSDDEWTHAYYLGAKGSNAADFAITTLDLFEHYEASLVPQLRFTSNDEADSRFQSLAFKGIRLYWDLACPTGDTFFLNSKYLSLVGHSQNWFRSTGFKESIDKDGQWSQVLSYGNMTVSNRARQARVTAQTV
jgi:hypothetical protein